jgi:hypothetical protein
MLRMINVTACASLSLVESGVPPLRQARYPLMLTLSTLHMSGNG